MDIRTALGKLADLEATVSITDPIRASVVKAYKYTPDRKQALSSFPCVINIWDLGQADPDNSFLRQIYTVQIQWFIKDANLDRGADIATAFHVAFVDKLKKDVSLGASVSKWVLRGGSPTLAMLDWAGQSYPGLNLLMDLTMKDAVSFT